MSRIFKVIILSLFIATSSMAGSDGQNELSKNTNGEVKDCFETVNRVDKFPTKLLVPVLIGEGKYKYPFAKGSKINPSIAWLNAKIPLFTVSKQSLTSPFVFLDNSF